MDTKEKIDRYLFVASNVLKDIEDDDMDWEYHQLLSFSTEWTYVCGAIQKLHILQAEMNEEQKRQYEILRQRVLAVENRLEKLDLPNPFAK